MENTYLDPEAMLKRIKDMQEQANKVYQEIQRTQGTMDELKENFEGTSAARLQQKYDELANTFQDLSNYLQKKAEDMQTLTGNVQAADEE